MSTLRERNVETDAPSYPPGWGEAYDPNENMMRLKGKDYLTVQERVRWFISDQRRLVMAGLGRVPFVIRTELVELDRERGWAHFRTTVCDVLGNEATMYGSESADDFGDYAEKAGSKSVGRALACLGYGTAAARDLDEGERVVDTPQPSRHRPAPNDLRPTGDIYQRALARGVVHSPGEFDALCVRVVGHAGEMTTAEREQVIAHIQSLLEPQEVTA